MSNQNLAFFIGTIKAGACGGPRPDGFALWSTISVGFGRDVAYPPAPARQGGRLADRDDWSR